MQMYMKGTRTASELKPEKVIPVGGRPRRTAKLPDSSLGTELAALGHMGGYIENFIHEEARLGMIGYMEVA